MSVNYQPLEIKGAHAFLRAMLNAGEDDLEAELRQYVLCFIVTVALFFFLVEILWCDYGLIFLGHRGDPDSNIQLAFRD